MTGQISGSVVHQYNLPLALFLLIISVSVNFNQSLLTWLKIIIIINVNWLWWRVRESALSSLNIGYILYTMRSKRTFKRCFISSRRKAASDDADWTEDGRAFHARAVASGNTWSPGVEHQVAGASVYMLSNRFTVCLCKLPDSGQCNVSMAP